MDDEGVTRPPAAPLHHLTRRSDDRMIGGVASGLADYFGLDPLVFRIGFVALALLGASGVLLYVLGWLLVPARGQRDSAAVTAVRATSFKRFAAFGLIGVALLLLIAGPLGAAWQFGPGYVFERLRHGPLEFLLAVFAALLPVAAAGALIYVLVRLVNSNDRGRVDGAEPGPYPSGGGRITIGIVLALISLLLFAPLLASVDSLGSLGPVESPLGWSLLLIAVGVALLRGERAQVAPVRSQSETFPQGPPGGSPASSPGRGASFATDPAWSPPPQAIQTWRPKRYRSPLGWIGLALAMLLASLLALLSNAGILSLDGASFLAVALLVLGATLVVGAFWGRARWLILVALFLLPFATFLSIVGPPLRGLVGSTYVAPRSAAALDEGYEILAGDLTLDLTRLPFEANEEVAVPVQMVAGGLSVIVPRGVTVEALGELGAGELSFFGESSTGFELEIDERAAGPGDKGRLVLDVDGALGSIRLYRDRQFAIGDPRREALTERRREARRERRRESDNRQTTQRRERAGRSGREGGKKTRGRR